MSDEILIFVLALLGGGLGSLASNLFIARLATEERKEARRKERRDFLLSTLNKIIDAHAIAKSYLAMPPAQDQKFEINKGKLITLPLSISDVQLNKLAIKIQESSNLEDITKLTEETITRLGELIKETSRVD